MPTKEITEQLWTELRSALLPFVRSRVPSKEIAEDIVHDVFLKIAQRINNLREDERLQAWAFSIARNAVIDYYRKTGRETEELPVVIESLEHDTDLTAEVASWLPRFLGELPESERTLLEHVELQGVSQKALAQRNSVPYSSLKSQVQRSRAKLKKLLEDCCRIDFDRRGNVIAYQSQNCDC